MMTTTKAPYYVAPPEPQFQEYAEAPTPQGREEEAALIGACLRRGQLFDELREQVKPASFGWSAYAEAWQAMGKLHAAGMGIDAVMVSDELARLGRLDTWQMHDGPMFAGIGRAAVSYVRDLGQPQNARSYAAAVLDYAAKRELSEIANLMAKWSANGRRAADILTDIEKKLSAVQVSGGLKADAHTATMKEALAKAYDQTDKASRGEITYIPTDYKALDQIVVGFTAPDLWIIGGLPGMGKTALMLNLARNAAKNGARVMFFTLEMAREQLAMRMVSMYSGISYQKQLTGHMPDDDWAVYNTAIEAIERDDMGIVLNDMPAISPARIRQQLRKNGPFDLVFVDYLQIMGPDEKYDVRNQEVAAIAQALKDTCKEFSVPIVAGAQMNRESQKGRSNARPQNSDLGESSKIEQVADKILFVHGESLNSTAREIIVSKHRNGPTGSANLTYIGFKTLFQDGEKL